jgi:hypothetical protein
MQTPKKRKKRSWKENLVHMREAREKLALLEMGTENASPKKDRIEKRYNLGNRLTEAREKVMAQTTKTP